MGLQDLGGVSGEIALGIRVSDTDINDAICSAGPKTTDTQLSTEFFSVLIQVSVNCWMTDSVILSAGKLGWIKGSNTLLLQQGGVFAI